MSEEFVDSDEEFMDSEEEFMEELKQEFIETVKRNVPALFHLLEENKLTEIAGIAHDIKGTAGLFDYEEGTEIAMELNVTAKNGDAEASRTYIQRLNAYFKEQGLLD
ncbi:MAG: Hpt domain-containing protein [bacterium]|nr:Hpt domain-containing protein [bacterium]